MRKQRKQYTADEKVFVLRMHPLDKVPVSEFCDEYGLRPTVFFRWQCLKWGAEAFRGPNGSQTTSLKQQVAQIEEKLAK